ncbi:tyrosine-type recombinase/integrase [Agromyces binzhouensis]|uniref:tyrosine-type recombinase/integrase n=1 Tax=Agromyces binzhouensis TaxID=1817495 RepID=UPI00362F0E06
MTTRKRSRAGWGKIRRLPSGRYQASHIGLDGLRYTGPITYTAKIDAQAWLAAQHAAIAAGTWTSAAARADLDAARAVTLGDYAARWLAERTNAKGERLRPRTVAEYRRLLDGPLAPLTGVALWQVTPAVIRSWRSALLDTGRATTTARAYGLLNAIMGTAAADGLIPANPCTIRGGQSTTTGRAVDPPTDDELDTIADAIPARFRALVLLAAWGGLRYGEATELRRRDVLVLPDGEIRVRVERAVTNLRGGFHVGPPKSAAGVRVVTLPPHVGPAVLAHLSDYVGRFPDSLLFPAALDGSTHLPQSSFWRHWDRARRAADRADLPFHALRHFAGTRYAQAGATLRETMTRLGHSTPAAAMRYQHTTGRDADLAARMSTPRKARK